MLEEYDGPGIETGYGSGRNICTMLYLPNEIRESSTPNVLANTH
jgi:hypothetical protein